MAKGTMTINGKQVPFDGEKNVLAVIRKAGINVPTLCYHPELTTFGACRLCVVETDRGKVDAACSLEPADGLTIYTNTTRLLKYRRTILELLLASHKRDCTTCEQSGNCRLQELASQFGVRNIRFEDTRDKYELDESSPSIVRDPNKCILCGNCVRMCEESQGMNVIDFTKRSSRALVAPGFNMTLDKTDCIGCGQCAAACPVGAITPRNDIGKVWRAIQDKNKFVSVQIAPAVRVAIGEHFGIAPGVNCIGKIVAALHMMGVDAVYDTSLGADLTVVEEAAEFLDRVQNGGVLPMYTSCCPAWIRYLEGHRPDLIKSASTCKSPMQMFSAVLREYYKEHDTGREHFHVGIFPCTAKKGEVARKEFMTDGKPDVAVVLTTQELITMIKEYGIDFANLEDEACDTPFGVYSGAGVIFGATGGVAEAVARCCYPDKSAAAATVIRYSGLRGLEGVKTATLQVGERTVKICVANGLANAQKVIAKIDAGEEYFDLVEVMACPGGCIGGAGQPQDFYLHDPVKPQRAKGLYAADLANTIKRSEANPTLQDVYDKIIKGRSHELLHVHYAVNE